ncbi:MAG TPA: hypothetical protein PKI15_02405 [Candidatus Cloacimonadota bacterium]|nr:hypothetical protein [Candidatus Cloacimonadota bacterium]
MSRYSEIDLFQATVYSVKDRPSKVEPECFARKGKIDTSLFLDCLPDILKAADFKEFVSLCQAAIRVGKPMIIGLGGHVIKCGLAPLLIELMESGCVSCFVINGSVSIHDWELAFYGKTSEDVSKTLANGSFGMVFETTHGINSTITKASADGLGYGEALGKHILENAHYKENSLLAMAYKHGIPVTVHVGLGTDIVHQTPCADGKAIGDCSLRDFRILCDRIPGLNEGGIFVDLGSAVVVPEVFLKALTVARNIRGPVKNFTTAVFDMNMQYRALENVVRRPVETGGKGFYFIGHHEIMIPLWIKSLLV